MKKCPMCGSPNPEDTIASLARKLFSMLVADAADVRAAHNAEIRKTRIVERPDMKEMFPPPSSKRRGK